MLAAPEARIEFIGCCPKKIACPRSDVVRRYYFGPLRYSVAPAFWFSLLLALAQAAAHESGKVRCPCDQLCSRTVAIRFAGLQATRQIETSYAPPGSSLLFLLASVDSSSAEPCFARSCCTWPRGSFGERGDSAAAALCSLTCSRSSDGTALG